MATKKTLPSESSESTNEDNKTFTCTKCKMDIRGDQREAHRREHYPAGPKRPAQAPRPGPRSRTR